MKNNFYLTAGIRAVRTIAFLFFLLTQVIVWGQGGGTGQSGTIIHRNYTGFPSENILQDSLNYLVNKLAPSEQASFKAYTIGLYRLNSKGLDDSNQRINSFISDSVAISSNFYLVFVTIWESDQKVSSLVLKSRLPASVPAIQAFGNQVVEKEGTAYLTISWENYKQNVNALGVAQAQALRAWTNFLFTTPKWELYYRGSIDSSAIKTGVDFGDSTASKLTGYNCVTPLMSVIKLPPAANHLKFNPCILEKVAAGALIAFEKEDKLYCFWGMDMKHGRLGIYAPIKDVSATGIESPDINDIFEPDQTGHEYNNIRTAFNVEPFMLQIFRAEVGLLPVFQNNYTIEYSQIVKTIPFVSLFSIGSLIPTTDECTFIVTPAYELVTAIGPAEIAKIVEVDNALKFVGNINVESQGPRKIYDYTGSPGFHTDEFELALLSAHNGFEGSCDIIITNTYTNPGVRLLIKGFKPQKRDALWIHVDASANTIRYEFLPKVLPNEEGLAVEHAKQIHLHGNKILKSIADKENLYNPYKATVNAANVIISIAAIQELIAQGLKIPEKFYDCENPNYVLAGLYKSGDQVNDDCVPIGVTIEAFGLTINELFSLKGITPGLLLLPDGEFDEEKEIIKLRIVTAYASGVWNGLLEAYAATGVTMLSFQAKALVTLDHSIFSKPPTTTDDIQELNSGSASPEGQSFFKDLDKDLVKLIDDQIDVNSTMFYYYKGFLLAFLPEIIEGAPAAGAFVDDASKVLKNVGVVLKTINKNPSLSLLFARCLKNGVKFEDLGNDLARAVFDGDELFRFDRNTGEVVSRSQIPASVDIANFTPELTIHPFKDASNPGDDLSLVFGKDGNGRRVSFLVNSDFIGEKIAAKYGATGNPSSPFYFESGNPNNLINRIIKNSSNPGKLLEDDIFNLLNSSTFDPALRTKFLQDAGDQSKLAKNLDKLTKSHLETYVILRNTKVGGKWDWLTQIDTWMKSTSENGNVVSAILKPDGVEFSSGPLDSRTFAFIKGDEMWFSYGGWGGNIRVYPGKTTTFLGRTVDDIEIFPGIKFGTFRIIGVKNDDRLPNFTNNSYEPLPIGPLTLRGKANPNGLSSLDVGTNEWDAMLQFYEQQGYTGNAAKALRAEKFWDEVNYIKLKEAFERGDDIRLLSNPELENIGFYKRELSAITDTHKVGGELKINYSNNGDIFVERVGATEMPSLMNQYGYSFNSATQTFFKVSNP